MKPKPDDRSDNVEKIQRNIHQTIHNMELADEIIHETDDKKEKEWLIEKNDRREHALEGLRREVKDEARAQKSKDK